MHGTVAADQAAWHSFTAPATAITPRTGPWNSSSVASNGSFVSVSRIDFNVGTDGVAGFGFGYTYSNGICGSGGGYSSAPGQGVAPIVKSHFESPGGSTGPWSGIGAGDFEGTFDSPTTAHGTASFHWTLIGTGIGCFTMSGTAGPFTWTASAK